MDVLPENAHYRSELPAHNKPGHAGTGRLFLVCPFCQIESFIVKQTGSVFFLTAPAAIFHIYDDDFFDPVDRFIAKENISHIYIVADTSCMFMNNVFENGAKYDIACETLIRKLLHEDDTLFSLAGKIVQQEVQLLSRKKIFQDRIKAGKLFMYGIVTAKAENRITVIA